MYIYLDTPCYYRQYDTKYVHITQEKKLKNEIIKFGKNDPSKKKIDSCGIWTWDLLLGNTAPWTTRPQYLVVIFVFEHLYNTTIFKLAKNDPLKKLLPVSGLEPGNFCLVKQRLRPLRHSTLMLAIHLEHLYHTTDSKARKKWIILKISPMTGLNRYLLLSKPVP